MIKIPYDHLTIIILSLQGNKYLRVLIYFIFIYILNRFISFYSKL